MSTLEALKSLACLNCDELSEILEENEYHNLANVILENQINGNIFLNLTEYQVQQFKGCQHEKIARQIFTIQKSPDILKIKAKFKDTNKLPQTKSQANLANRPLPSLPTENKLGARPKYLRFKSLPNQFSSDFVAIKESDYTCPPPDVATTSPLYETRRILRKQNEESNYPLIYQSPSVYHSCRSSISSGYGSILYEYDDEQIEGDKSVYSAILKQTEGRSMDIETEPNYYEQKETDKAVYVANLKKTKNHFERIEIEPKYDEHIEKDASKLNESHFMGIETESKYFDVKEPTSIYIIKKGTAESDLSKFKNESSDFPKTEKILIPQKRSEGIFSNLHNKNLQLDEVTSSKIKNEYSDIKALAEIKINSINKFTNTSYNQTKLSSIEEQNDGTSSDDSLCEIEEKLILRLYKKELRKKLLK